MCLGGLSSVETGMPKWEPACRELGPQWPTVEQPMSRCERSDAMVKKGLGSIKESVPVSIHISHRTEHHPFENKVWEIYIFVKKCIRSLSYLPTTPLGQDMTQGQFFSGVQQVWIQSFPSPRLVASPWLKNQSVLLFTHSWRENNWIHTFPKGISAMWNAISVVLDLNSCRRVHKKQRWTACPSTDVLTGVIRGLKNPIELEWEELDTKCQSQTTHKCGSPLATLERKLGRTIFSLPPIFGGMNAENRWSSDTDQWGSFWWINFF